MFIAFLVNYFVRLYNILTTILISLLKNSNILIYLFLIFQLVHEANMALKILTESGKNNFEPLFIHKKSFIEAYDQIIHIK